MKFYNSSRLGKVMQRAIACLSMIVLIGLGTEAHAQKGAKGAYDQAVDQINCKTVEFIHREQARIDVANSMDCSTYEGITMSIPPDEKKTTGQLAASINQYKSKYKDSEPLPDQIDKVIREATKAILAKTRKGSTEDFKTQLQQIKAQAVTSLGSAPAGGATEPTPSGDIATLTDDEDNPISEEETADDLASGGGSSNMFSFLVLFIGLSALALAIYTLMTVKRLKNGVKNGAGPSGLSPADQLAIQRAQRLADEALQKIKRLESELDNNKTNYPVSSRAIKTQPAMPEPTYAPIEAPSEPMIAERTEAPAIAPSMASNIAEGGNQPYYKYAPASTDGVISPEMMSDHPVVDTVLEIEIFPDVPNRAFYSILNFPDTIKRVMDNPEQYLTVFCEYSYSPAGKKTLIMEEEGILRLENENWVVHEKAKINFE